MRLIQLVDFFSEVLNVPAYPLQFPVNCTDESTVVVDVISGSYDSSIVDLTVQIFYRSKHPATAEELANTHINLLHNMTNRVYEEWQIIQIMCTSPNPFLTGQDSEKNYVYTVDYRLLVTKI